ncbi:MAG: XRE family transcriptional regulator [Candidatus Eremiobacteraeota bacterium]|nr:XRE family transcriptional regulator [Candidatus Eremiobacteraeota bacterium]
MIGARLLQARRAAGLSLRELAARAEISAMALSKYERDLMSPAPASLEKLARVLSVDADFFHCPLKIALSEPSFRKRGTLSRREGERITFALRQSLERMLDLEHIFGVARSAFFSLPPAVTREVRSLEDVELRADSLRQHWNLGAAPLESVASIMEEHGIKVFVSDAPEGVDGFSCRARGGWVNAREAPVIVISSRLPGDRQRFSMLHELGHLVLDTAVDIDREKACHRFAGAFLVPREAALRELGVRRSRLSFYELKILKQKYGISMQALVYRAADLAVISRTMAQGLFTAMSRRGWKKKEPCEIGREEPRRYKLLLFQAVVEGLITRQQALEYLGEPVEETRHELEAEWVFEELSELLQDDFPDLDRAGFEQ